MSVTQEDLSRIVAEVVARLGDRAKEVKAGCGCSGPSQGSGHLGPQSGCSGPSTCACPPKAPAGTVVFQNVDEAVAAAAAAQRVFWTLGLEKRRAVVAAMREAALEHAERLARLAVEETGMGRAEDKLVKNRVVAEKTPGVEDLRSRSYTGDQGLTLVEYAPFGVVAAVTPSTNPAATVISNAIGILSAGNAVVFAPHPSARKVSQEAMRVLDAAVRSAGGPGNLLTTVAAPTHETTRALLAHPEVRLNMVTGGPAIVKVALTIGKICKTIAAGPGNPPVVVDETARFPDCARDVITGASFDNCVLCTGEKEVIVTRAAEERFLAAMRADARAFELSREQMDALARKVIVEGGRGCPEPRLDRELIGKDAAVIARAIGLEVPAATRLLWGRVPNEHDFIWTEQLMPVLPVTVAEDVDAAIELAAQAEGGHRHTAAMHSMSVDHLTRMARRLQCSIYVKNAPTIYGLGLGEGYATMSIGTPTGDGLTKTSHFARPLHCSLVGYFRIA